MGFEGFNLCRVGPASIQTASNNIYYNWAPNVPLSTTTTGNIRICPIPNILMLPDYFIRTETENLAVTDQWSEIILAAHIYSNNIKSGDLVW